MIDIAALVAVAAIAAPAPASLSMHDAHDAARIAANQTMQAFTERTPRIDTTCHRLTSIEAACRVRARGDRARLVFTATVRLDTDGLTVYGSRLRVD